jgi:hypothetical protein
MPVGVIGHLRDSSGPAKLLWGPNSEAVMGGTGGPVRPDGSMLRTPWKSLEVTSVAAARTEQVDGKTISHGMWQQYSH